MCYLVSASLLVGGLIVGIVSAVLSPAKPVAEATGTVLKVASDHVPKTIIATVDGVEKVFEVIPTQEGE